MNNKKLVRNWQAAIIREAEKRLARDLTDSERSLITSRGGFFALEMIEDTVNGLEGDDLIAYLNQEADEP